MAYNPTIPSLVLNKLGHVSRKDILTEVAPNATEGIQRAIYRRRK
jgi:hypothetical protein